MAHPARASSVTTSPYLFAFDNPPAKPPVSMSCCYFEEAPPPLLNRKVICLIQGQTTFTCEMPPRLSLWDKITSCCSCLCTPKVGCQPDYLRAIDSFSGYLDMLQTRQIAEWITKIDLTALKKSPTPYLLVGQAEALKDIAIKCSRVHGTVAESLKQLRDYLLFQGSEVAALKLAPPQPKIQIFVDGKAFDEEKFLKYLQSLMTTAKEATLKAVIKDIKDHYDIIGHEVRLTENELKSVAFRYLRGRGIQMIPPSMHDHLNFTDAKVREACQHLKQGQVLTSEEEALFYEAIIKSTTFDDHDQKSAE